MSLRRVLVPSVFEGLLSLALLTAFLCARDLPLVDLPQHAVQLSNWLAIDAGEKVAAGLELNFRTPYLLAYPIAWLLAHVVSVLTALKLTFAAAVALQAVTLRKLCEALGHDRWLGLLGFPLGLGYSFCWGFVAFCAALPLVNLAFWAAFQHHREPRLRSGLWLSLLLALLLLAHGVALGFGLVVLGALLIFGGGGCWQRLAPLLSPCLVGLIWLAPGHSSTRLGGDYWALELWRMLELPAELVGIGSVDAWASAFGVLLLLAIVASSGRPRSWSLALPLLVALCGYLFFPTLWHGAGPLHPRFVAFVVPALLVALPPRVPGVLRPASLRWFLVRASLLGVTLGVPLLFCLRLADYNRELRAFYAVIDDLPAHLSIRPLVFERASRAYPGTPVMLHVPAYYALEKGGDAGYSFAMYSISVVRFRPGVRIKMGSGAEWAPERFDARREASDYDYFIVKSASDRSTQLFPGPSPLAQLERHVGDWWGYRRTTPRD